MKKTTNTPGKEWLNTGSPPDNGYSNNTTISNENEILDLGEEPEQSDIEIHTTREKINEYDIYRLAIGILIFGAIILVLFGLIRSFYSVFFKDDQGIKDVWNYSKTTFQYILVLVLGLYFGKIYGKLNK